MSPREKRGERGGANKGKNDFPPIKIGKKGSVMKGGGGAGKRRVCVVSCVPFSYPFRHGS